MLCLNTSTPGIDRRQRGRANGSHRIGLAGSHRTRKNPQSMVLCGVPGSLGGVSIEVGLESQYRRWFSVCGNLICTQIYTRLVGIAASMGRLWWVIAMGHTFYEAPSATSPANWRMATNDPKQQSLMHPQNYRSSALAVIVMTSMKSLLLTPCEHLHWRQPKA